MGDPTNETTGNRIQAINDQHFDQMCCTRSNTLRRRIVLSAIEKKCMQNKKKLFEVNCSLLVYQKIS